MFKPLRDKILELAITGKLVPQLDSEPAVEQIGPAPAQDEVPFELPNNWKLVYLSEIATLINGRAYSKNELLEKREGLTPIVRVGNFFTNSKYFYSDLKLDEKNYCEKGDLLFAWSASFGPKLWDGPRSIFHYHIWKVLCSQHVDKLWLFYWFWAKTQELKDASHGTTMVHITKAFMESNVVALPPLEEQRRIVAKLDDIMGNLERMDQAYTELSGPMLKHFKNLVLQQAISGQLVPQLDSEPAVEQLGPAPKPEEVPFAIPEKWKWVALEDLFQFVDYRGKTPIKSASGVRLITSSNVRKGYLDHTRCEYISIDEYQSRQSRGVSHKGDILFTTEAPLGNVALADLDVFSVGQRVITLKSKGLALNECFVWFLLSNYFQTEILKQATGSTVQGIKAARLKKLVLPLPPIEEQKRIAARINKLFAEADKLLALKELSL